jgi:hypothetical protein
MKCIHRDDGSCHCNRSAEHTLYDPFISYFERTICCYMNSPINKSIASKLFTLETRRSVQCYIIIFVFIMLSITKNGSFFFKNTVQLQDNKKKRKRTANPHFHLALTLYLNQNNNNNFKFRLISSGMWYYFLGQVIPSVWKDHIPFIFRVNLSKESGVTTVFVNNEQTRPMTRRHVSEDLKLQQHHCQNLVAFSIFILIHPRMSAFLALYELSSIIIILWLCDPSTISTVNKYS